MIKKISCVFFVALLLVWAAAPVLADTHDEQLPECVVITHCVRVDLRSVDVEALFNTAERVIKDMPRTNVVELTDSYLHAEVQTKWLRYTDDLLVKALPGLGIVQVRSESRVGVDDKGFNKKRVEELAYRLMTNQT